PTAVPAGRVLPGQALHAGFAGGDPDGRRGLAEHVRVLQLHVLPVVVDASVAEERDERLDILLEAGDEPVGGDTERLELRVVPARADPEDEAAARERGERLRLPRELAGRTERRAEDERAELDPRRLCREVREERERLRAG